MRSNNVRLGLRQFEGRDVPNCTVVLGGPDTLVITGDAKADAITLTDDGAGKITGSATGAGQFSYAGIRHIKIDTGDGNDRVTYTLAKNLQAGQLRAVSVILGTGNDSFLATLSNPRKVGSDLLAKANLEIFAESGAGTDQLDVDATRDVDVAAGAQLKVLLSGGTGVDGVTAVPGRERRLRMVRRPGRRGRGRLGLRPGHRDVGSTGRVSTPSNTEDDGVEKMTLLLFRPRPSWRPCRPRGRRGPGSGDDREQ